MFDRCSESYRLPITTRLSSFFGFSSSSSRCSPSEIKMGVSGQPDSSFFFFFFRTAVLIFANAKESCCININHLQEILNNVVLS